MSALATLVVVWLGAEKPEGHLKTALDEWPAAKGAILEAPRGEPVEDGSAARAIAERCDEGLGQARDQLNAGDYDGSRQALARIEQTLRDHPDLLQASWLMAERFRLEALVAARTSENPATWQDRADALEGTREHAFGEAERQPREPARLSITLAVHGARTHETYWNGVKTGDTSTMPPGEHHLAIARGKRVVWSGWVSVLANAVVDVWIPDAAPCSLEDLDGVAFSGETEVAVPKGVRCEAWAVARPGANEGTMNAALCARDRCQPASTWAYEIFTPAPSAREVSKKALPAWATWTLAGVGAAAAASVILWRTGAFDRAEPAPKVVYDGSGL